MRWSLQFPIQLFTIDDDGEVDPVSAAHAPLAVRNAIAEACWSLGQALSRTTSQLTLVATIDGEGMEEKDNGQKRSR